MKKTILLCFSLIFLKNIPAIRHKKQLINNTIKLDNFDIISKSTLSNQKINSSENNTNDLNNAIYSIIDLIDMWILYNNEMKDFTNSLSLFLKNFFGIRLINNSFENETKKQYFIENIIEKVSCFYLKASSDLQYLCNAQIQYLLSFKYDLIESISSNYIYKLINLGYYNENFLQFKIKDNQIPKSNEDCLNELLSESAEIGILKNAYIYNLFEKEYMNILNNNKIYQIIKLTKNILLEKIIHEENNKKMELLIKNFYIKKNDENDFIIWFLNKDQVNDSIITLINEDSIFLLFLIKLIAESIKKDTNKIFYFYLNKYDINIINKIAEKSNFILFSLLNLFSNNRRDINWNKMPLIVINEITLRDFFNYLKLLI